MRLKTCKVCRAQFEPSRPMQTCCGPYCAVQLGQKRVMVRERQKTRELKTKLKSRAQWRREAQAAWNWYIRARDAADPCISCGRMHEKQWHAGHYRTTKAAPWLALGHPSNPVQTKAAEDNCHKQCSACNTYLSGNIVSYRKILKDKIGPERLEIVEGPEIPVSWTVEDYRCAKALYGKRARELEAKNG